MPSRSLAKGKKLLLGKEEKEVLVEESWWGAVQRGRSIAETPPQHPAPELSAEEEITVALSPPSGHPGCAPTWQDTVQPAAGSPPPPSPSPFPFLGSCASTPCVPL